LSVVTPSFNQGHFVRATIESVLSQDYPNIQYIIMDGGSTDETASVVKDYGSRLIFISEKDRGQPHAINKGFQMAHGTLLAWLNSDDTGSFNRTLKFPKLSRGDASPYDPGVEMVFVGPVRAPCRPPASRLYAKDDPLG
jgi:glycosyltransferase involved in cell wall biosynthesis